MLIICCRLERIDLLYDSKEMDGDVEDVVGSLEEGSVDVVCSQTISADFIYIRLQISTKSIDVKESEKMFVKLRCQARVFLVVKERRGSKECVC